MPVQEKSMYNVDVLWIEIASDGVCGIFSAVTSELDPFLFGQADLGLSYTLAVWKSQI